MKRILILTSLLLGFSSFAQVIDGPLDFLDNYPVLEKKIQESYPTSKIELHSFSQRIHPSYPSIRMLIGEFKVGNNQKSQTAYYFSTKGSDQFTILGGYRKFKDECRYDQNGSIHFSMTSSSNTVNNFMRDICIDIVGDFKSKEISDLSVNNNSSRENTKGRSLTSSSKNKADIIKVNNQ